MVLKTGTDRDELIDELMTWQWCPREVLPDVLPCSIAAPGNDTYFLRVKSSIDFQNEIARTETIKIRNRNVYWVGI